MRSKKPIVAWLLNSTQDRNQGDKEAEEKFKKINEAYQILSDEQKREIYDKIWQRRIKRRWFWRF